MIGKYDIKVARQVWREKIAEDRKLAFEKNDMAIRDAQLENDESALKAALARRDELRALGDKIDAAKNIKSLSAITVK